MIVMAGDVAADGITKWGTSLECSGSSRYYKGYALYHIHNVSLNLRENHSE